MFNVTILGFPCILILLKVHSEHYTMPNGHCTLDK